jgi:hypothetical protein
MKKRLNHKINNKTRFLKQKYHFKTILSILPKTTKIELGLPVVKQQ